VGAGALFLSDSIPPGVFSCEKHRSIAYLPELSGLRSRFLGFAFSEQTDSLFAIQSDSLCLVSSMELCQNCASLCAEWLKAVDDAAFAHELSSPDEVLAAK